MYICNIKFDQISGVLGSLNLTLIVINQIDNTSCHLRPHNSQGLLGDSPEPHTCLRQATRGFRSQRLSCTFESPGLMGPHCLPPATGVAPGPDLRLFSKALHLLLQQPSTSAVRRCRLPSYLRLGFWDCSC